MPRSILSWVWLHTIGVISSAWTWNIAGLILCAVLLAARGVKSAWFLAGIGILALLLCSPLDLLARDYLFTAYAIEQLLIGLVIPYFLTRGAPLWRIRIPTAAAWIAGMLSLSIWFLPRLLNVTLISPTARTAELVILLLGGVAFWWPIHSPGRDHRISLVPNTLIYLAAGTVFCSLLGLLLAFEQPLLIARYVQSPDPLHISEFLLIDASFSRETDQQTAGLLFWIGAAAVLLTEVMFTYYRWYKSAASFDDQHPQV